VEVPEDLQRPETSAGDGLGQGTIVFDVIGTLFSTRVAARAFEELGMPAHAFDSAFAEALRDAFALSLAGGYAPLADVLEASLRRSLERQGMPGADPASVLAAMRKLDPVDGAGDAVRVLSDRGLRLVTLTNGAAGLTRALLEHAGVADRFHALLSCDEVRVSKPHPKTYALARRDARREAWLVASHAWDVQGAARAGFRTAWISTLEKRYLEVYPRPDVQAEDVRSAAKAILARLAA
jgi:2-haloacid dehalogenase